MIRINKAGYLYTILTISIGFSAVNTGNNLVYIVASALLSYMLVSGLFGRRNIQGIEVGLEFPEEIYAGAEVPVRVRLKNRRRFMPAFLITVSAGGREALFPYVRARGSEHDLVTLRFDRRGVARVDDLCISSVFPFNLFTRYRKLAEKFEVVVFPAPRKCSIPELSERDLRKSGNVVSDVCGHASDIVGIRDYSVGDPLKYVSWKSTAKTGRLKTKEFSAEEDRQVMIEVEKVASPDQEHAVSCAAYAILRLIRSGVPVGLRAGGETIKPGASPAHRVRLLTRLALYGQG